MQRRSALEHSALPPVLLKATPRPVRVNASGGAMLVAAMGLIVAGICAGIVLTERAATAERRLRLFASERIVTAGEVLRLRRRGGDDGYRITVQ